MEIGEIACAAPAWSYRGCTLKLSDGSQVQSWSGQSCHIRNPVMYRLTEKKKKETSMLQLINREKNLAII